MTTEVNVFEDIIVLEITETIQSSQVCVVMQTEVFLRAGSVQRLSAAP